MKPRQGRDFDPRSIAPAGAGFGDLFPELAARAIVCEQYPKLDLRSVRVKSSLYIIWRCVCGTEFRRKVTDITRRRAVLCGDCTAGGKSRMEFEVAELLRLMLGTEVVTHHGASRKDQVDLYLPQYEVAAELDPRWSHAQRLECDIERLQKHRGTYGHAVRLREAGLPAIDGCLTVPTSSPSQVWAAVLSDYLNPGCRRVLNDGEQRDALQRAGRAWLRLQTTPPSPALADRPDLVAEFMEDLGLPGRGPEWISLGSGTLCRWQCPVGHVYELTVDRRTGPQAVGCRQCGRQRTIAARRRPPKGGSAADAAPGLLAEFVANVSNPPRDLTMLRPRSHDMCLWRCSKCSQEWRATVKNRYVGPHRGCKSCNLTRAWSERRKRDDGRMAEHRRAALAALVEYADSHGHARVPASYVTPDGFHLGEWVNWQRDIRARLPEELAEALEAFPGWSWSVKRDQWEAGFAALERYVAREKDAKVPTRHQEDGYSLGMFVQKQRQRYQSGQLSAERRRRLESVPGWQWRVYAPRRT